MSGAPPDAADAAGALDLLLTDAALGVTRRFRPDSSLLRLAVADHLCPWQSCYRTTQLLGGPVTFVLSTSGHIASMINSPANPKAYPVQCAAPGTYVHDR
jgi:hypothetical protein